MAPGDRRFDLSEGDRFAGYTIERQLGRGGMGVLYLALEPGLERRVALKLIAPEAAADEVFRRRFAEESKIAAAIEHPNVVPIYAAGEEEGVAFIAMRYVSGSDLARRLAKVGLLQPAAAVSLAAQIGNGLDAIHAAGLVHRDVKPANVLLSGEEGSEHAYITDFGVARNVATESGLTQTGRFVGTLDYVAPEQISGQPIDARADVYALGCLLYKLLTGEVPFPKETEAARLYAHLNEPPPAPSLFAPDLSMALDDVVARAMSKAPEDRYPSAGDFGRAAEASLRGERPALPERTVATGEAATRTAETLAPDAFSTPEGHKGIAGDSAPSSAVPTASTRRLPTERPRPTGVSSGRRRTALAAIAAAAVVTLLAVLVLGGGDEGAPRSPAAGDGGASAADSPGRGSDSGPRPEPTTMTPGELVTAADRVCEESQRRYLEVRDLERESQADVPYASALVRIANKRIRGLGRLKAPPGLSGPYGDYVAAQERVLETDRAALAAARAGDPEGVRAARARRDSEDALREGLAREIGFTVCSTPQS